ncbi:ER membrane protein complex subunit 10 isoform X2 [Oratosquilla oratoria]|uniref:ER membrane protein complex subunit 10 isoform X2 n=1 Tax=Oratosquilla oratoria TaxID=337810 RepID=UPI003F7779E3
MSTVMKSLGLLQIFTFFLTLAVLANSVYSFQDVFEDKDGEQSMIYRESIYQPADFQDDDYFEGQLTLIVEDSLDGGATPTFSQRSTINIRSVKSDHSSITHTHPWTQEKTEKLKDLAKRDELYHLRVYQKGAEDKGYVSTFTRACQLYESALAEFLSVQMDHTLGGLSGISIATPVVTCRGNEVDQLMQHNSTVIVRSPTPAPVPDTATYIQKLEAMKHEKAEGKDNRSFLAKYWMYIIPVVLIMMLSGGGQEGGR